MGGCVYVVEMGESEVIHSLARISCHQSYGDGVAMRLCTGNWKRSSAEMGIIHAAIGVCLVLLATGKSGGIRGCT